jgi:hypothetical protein
MSLAFNHRYPRHLLAFLGPLLMIGLYWQGHAINNYELHFAIGMGLLNLIFLLIELWSEWMPLAADHKKIYNAHFKKMSRGNFKTLMNAATLENKANGSTITQQGKRTEKVLMIVDGHAVVIFSGKIVAQLGNGDFIGDLSFISGNVASATVRSEVLTTYLIWEQDRLRETLRKNPMLLVQFNQMLERQITKKLINKENAVAS